MRGLLDFVTTYSHLWANLLLSIAIAMMPLLGWFLEQYTREKVLNNLVRDYWCCLRRKGYPDEDILDDIKSLGGSAPAGAEKEQALAHLGTLAEMIQTDGREATAGLTGVGRLWGWAKAQAQKTRDAATALARTLLRQGRRPEVRYTGASLEGYLLALEATLQGGDADNLSQGADVLQQIVERLMESRDLADSPDMFYTLGTLERVGIRALGLDSGVVPARFIAVLMPIADGPHANVARAAKVLLKWGAESLRGHNYDFAVAVFSKLEALTEAQGALTAENSADYLGLSAHFWTAGPMEQQFVKRRLGRLRFDPSLRECLLSAQSRSITDFETANKLAQMLKEMAPKRRGLLPRLLSIFFTL